MSRRPILDPVETPGTRGSTVLTHPAFGQIRASRVTGLTTLYGSDFHHHSFVEITIQGSELHRDLSSDHYHAQREIASVRMSELQWAGLISSMNIGMGVPCTIDHVLGDRRPDLPLRTQESAFKAEVREKTESVVAGIDATIEDLLGEIGSSLSNTKRDKLLARLRKARQEMADNLPFVATNFAKHMEDTVERAKGEVAAYITTATMRAGISAINGGQAPILSLGAGDEDERATASSVAETAR